MFIELIYGFLGAEKTTFIRHLLEHPGAGERRVILVNEFGEVGIDGRILAHAGTPAAAVTVMNPSGGVTVPTFSTLTGCIRCLNSFKRNVMATWSGAKAFLEQTGNGFC